jgi:hypothetical protein
MCQTRGKKREADRVATTADGLQWFECRDHDPTDNIGGNTRMMSEPIEAWRTRHGIGRTRFKPEAVCMPIASFLASAWTMRHRELNCPCGRRAAFVIDRIGEPLRLLCDDHGCAWDKVFE